MMSVLKDFYTVKSIQQTGDLEYLIEISLNASHEIFKGHFPANPVTPGVCTMQIVKDLTEFFSNEKLLLSSASNVKFMAIINPETDPELQLELVLQRNDGEIKTKASASFGETVAMKMSATYKVI